MSVKRILIIDDDVAHLSSTRGLLEGDGYEVFTHTQGFGATNVARQLRPDLILLDVNMPGLSGENLIGVLQSNPKTRDLKVVFYSSNDEDLLRQAVKRFGAHGYISKGNPMELRSKVEKFLRTVAIA